MDAQTQRRERTARVPPLTVRPDGREPTDRCMNEGGRDFYRGFAGKSKSSYVGRAALNC